MFKVLECKGRVELPIGDSNAADPVQALADVVGKTLGKFDLIHLRIGKGSTSASSVVRSRDNKYHVYRAISLEQISAANS